MTLAEAAQAIVGQFEYSDDDVNRGVKEFLRQMGMSCVLLCLVCDLLLISHRGPQTRVSQKTGPV